MVSGNLEKRNKKKDKKKENKKHPYKKGGSKRTIKFNKLDKTKKDGRRRIRTNNSI